MSYVSFLGLLSFIDMRRVPTASTLLSVCSALYGTFAPTTLKELCMLRIMNAHDVNVALLKQYASQSLRLVCGLMRSR